MRKATNFLKSTDERLADLITQAGPCKLISTTRGNANRIRHRSPFEALAESIAYQQLHGKAAATIWGRVVDIYGGKKLGTPKEILKTPDEALRKAGLSRSKLLALKDLAAKANEQIIPSWKALEKLDDDEIINRLTTVRGIGPWTVQMLLIFEMGRPDVLPSTDFGVQRGYQLTYNRRNHPKPKELIVAGEHWKPFRSIASWYMWRAVDIHRRNHEKQ